MYLNKKSLCNRKMMFWWFLDLLIFQILAIFWQHFGHKQHPILQAPNQASKAPTLEVTLGRYGGNFVISKLLFCW